MSSVLDYPYNGDTELMVSIIISNTYKQAYNNDGWKRSNSAQCISGYSVDGDSVRVRDITWTCVNIYRYNSICYITCDRYHKKL